MFVRLVNTNLKTTPMVSLVWLVEKEKMHRPRNCRAKDVSRANTNRLTSRSHTRVRFALVLKQVRRMNCARCSIQKDKDVYWPFVLFYCLWLAAIVPFTNQGVTEWPPIMNDQGITEGVTVTDYKFEGNFSAANASYCPYFTLQSGRCDDHKGGVYILNQNDCAEGATTVGWKKDLYTNNGKNGQPNLNNYTHVGEIKFPESNNYYTYPWPFGEFLLHWNVLWFWCSTMLWFEVLTRWVLPLLFCGRLFWSWSKIIQ